MRVRRLAPAAVALLLTLALAACSGGAPPPEAPLMSEAASTPAPTAAATPEATPPPEATPTPTPEQACSNGIAVADPDAHPLLVADCEMLLRAKDALRGDAPLDWGGGLAIADWEGVAVSGEPPHATGLDLRGKGLTGSIPRALRRLRLGEALFAGNALTGCVPSAFEDAAHHDAASLGLPWCLRYDRLDATGTVAEAGSWAILDANGEALTTWEGLRSEAAMLRVHQTDAGGSSWAAEFGAVAVNDLFEWRKASDCWVRYRVADAPMRPASDASGRWEFPIEWMTYAYTGAGCAGAVGAGTVLRVDEEPANIQSPHTASPVRHGPWLMHRPQANRSVFEQRRNYWPTKALLDGVQINPGDELAPPEGVRTNNLTEARKMQFWRDPVLPAGVTFSEAESGLETSPDYGYCAKYTGSMAVKVCVYFSYERPHYRTVYFPGAVQEALVIDKFPSLVRYSAPGPLYSPYFSPSVWIFDTDTGLMYHVSARYSGAEVDTIIEIARSLMHPKNS